ncbi:muscular LMNA-interacting protein isoform X7 [Rhinatrema bivittatum]|uniref:muscular LMNA-interacting protein isoform X7 n=1 Tax=Rhinatrema bivittatum TaxID=194408 RepID=UPI00112BD287|nr:muscular LMNA-interacting protein isoform X7 [Rhinatrema bivittatum]
MELRKDEAGILSKKPLKEKLMDNPFTKNPSNDILGRKPGLCSSQHRKQIADKDLSETFLDSEQALPGELGTKPLTFTFVPSVRRLPAHFQIVESSKLIFKSAEKPNRGRCEETLNKATLFSDYLVLGSGVRQATDMQDLASHRVSNNQQIHQDNECAESKAEEMQRNDVFQAEFVLITDSDDGEEEMTTKSNDKHPTVIAVVTDHRQARIQSLAMPSDSMGEAVPEAVRVGMQTVPEVRYPELSQDALYEQKESQEYKIKSSYKALAAIPTNTLLLEQKALDDPVKTPYVAEEDTSETHSELCSPAQLRQQTDELCAAIDKVLQDPLPMHHHDVAPESPQVLTSSDAPKMLMTMPRTAGRETRYALLSSPVPTIAESQMTKPGVIRPLPGKAKIILKKEEACYPNPFNKYVEGTSRKEMQHLLHSTTCQNKSDLGQHDGNGKINKGTRQKNERTPYCRRLLMIREDLGDTSAKQSKGKK